MVGIDARCIIFVATLVCFCCCQNHDITKIPDRIDFNFHVRPILSDRCFACHGPDENTREAGLRLDTREGAFAILDSVSGHRAIRAGDWHNSPLVTRTSSNDPDLMMPPPESKLHLTDRERLILKEWVRQGAEWKDHWAFEPPRQEEIESGSHPVDYFVTKKLKEVGLKPSPVASKEKLIRRLSFDLRGLPPTLDEIDHYLEDESDTAYEKLVDHFLADENFGERMAVEWMDVARYADSHGYQDDIERSMWPWRDWVIGAFNQDMSYRDFVTWQLGGDLIDDATYEQQLATGFNRNHKITQEVGVVDEEYRVTYVLDRTNTFATAFLGLTVECAQCHDHKYDPISQKEYYQLFSFFNQVPEKGRVDYGIEVAEPHLALPDTKIEEIKTYVDQSLARQASKLTTYSRDFELTDLQLDQLKQSLANRSTNMPHKPHAWYPLDHLADGTLQDVVSGKSGQSVNKLIPVPGISSGAIEFVGNNYADISLAQSIDLSLPFTIAFWLKSIDGGIRGSILQGLNANKEVNFNLSVTNNKNFRVQVGKAKANIFFHSKDEVPANEWVHICLVYDGSKKAQGLQLYMNGVAVSKYDSFYSLANPVRPVTILLGGSYNFNFDQDSSVRKIHGIWASQLDELMFFTKALTSKQLAALRSYQAMSDLTSRPDLRPADHQRLKYHWLHHHDPHFRTLIDHYRSYKIRQMRAEDIQLKPTMVMADMDTLRPTFVLDRGQYDAPAGEVEHGTPQSILAFPEHLPRNRLGLAQWLFSDEHPLTARVAVNRYWQMIFGRGLVATPEDFGSQGELPSHPELLDWLAIDFKDSGWKIKSLIKQMVMSETYRQSVVVRSEQLEIDPDNTYLSRGPQRRLPAEMIRDHALAISGLLSTRVGGPSVKPYQPAGLWLEVASGNQSLRKYIQDHDSDLYRKSMYTFWKRTLPPPSMLMFDASTREQCSVERPSTSTPMQALVLLNDPQFVEASKLIAQRMLLEGGEDARERINFAFRLATSRQPSREELDVLVDLFNSEFAHFSDDQPAARQLLEIGEFDYDTSLDISQLAALTSIANTILNLTESTQKS